MNLVNKSGWVFLIVVLLFSVGIIGYIKDDSFFGLYSFENQQFAFAEPVNSQVYFCPEDFCSEQLIAQINSATEAIDIAIYSFTHDGIAEAIIDAKNRGVKVRVVFDYLQAAGQYSVDELIELEGIEIKIRKSSGSMHNKFCIIDGKKVLTGSFNYSNNADEKNDENLILLIDEELAKLYLSEFEELWIQAKVREEWIE